MSAFVAEQIVDLVALFNEQVNVAVYPRTLPEALREEARRRIEDGAPPLKLAVKPGEAALGALRRHLPASPLLAEDIAFWVDALAELTGADHIGARLAAVRSAMCPRMHVDHVALRVVSTYVGVGTEYQDEALHQAQSGALVFLKGEGWPGNAGRGAVHRSPALQAGEARLVLTLDPL